MRELTEEERTLLSTACNALLVDLRAKEKAYMHSPDIKEIMKRIRKDRSAISTLNNVLINRDYKMTIGLRKEE